jgi:hypothetical protein
LKDGMGEWMSNSATSGWMQGAEMAAYPVPALEPATETPVREKAWDRPKREDGWDVLAPRSGPGFGVLEGVALFVYGLLLAWVIPHHEAWFDEAQAWLIARDSSLVDLVAHRLHYEGAPAFWHLLLWVEVRLGVSFLGMHLIAGAVAVAGMYVWLRYSRLPRAVNLLTPFTFYVVFQYAVVARDYVLAPLLIFVLTALYSNRRSSPWVFALVAGVLANCSLHMASVATGMAILYGVDRVRHREGRSVSFLVGPTLLLVGLLVASAATAVPTMDGSSTTWPCVEACGGAVDSDYGADLDVEPVGVWISDFAVCEPGASEDVAGVAAVLPAAGVQHDGGWRGASHWADVDYPAGGDVDAGAADAEGDDGPRPAVSALCLRDCDPSAAGRLGSACPGGGPEGAVLQRSGYSGISADAASERTRSSVR